MSTKCSNTTSAAENKKTDPKLHSGQMLAHSSKEDLVEELRRAQDALALLRLEQAKLDLCESEDTAEPQIASPERPTGLARSSEVQKRRQRRRQNNKKKSTQISSRYQNSVQPHPMKVSLTPRLSDSINFYDGTSLLDVIEAVEDSDLSLSSIGFEDDDLDGVSVNTSMEHRVDGDSPVLYIAAAPRRHGAKTKGRRRRKKIDDNADASEASSASVLWSSVGKYLNNQNGRETQGRTPRTIVERPGGREGDYWGAFPGKSSSRTPSRFSNRWREEAESNQFQRNDTMEEVYEDDISLGGESSKGEPIYKYR